MHKVLVMGAGKIGSLITFLLANSGDYFVYLADIVENNPHIDRLGHLNNFKYVHLDAKDTANVSNLIKQKQIEAIISSLPFHRNVAIAKIAAEHNINYFDLTEDVKTTLAIQELSKNSSSAFVQQCGLAPGFISIITNYLMKHFNELDTVKMRVGALPTNISNALQYSLTWSTEGLINEYANPCPAIENGEHVNLQPLDGHEEIKIDGLPYEAFNTSGGIGSLAETYHQKVKNLSYKTIRYPGHCAKVKFLMNDLKLKDDRETLKRIFEHTIPRTYQDVVLVYVSVTGKQEGQFIEENYIKKFYPKKVNNLNWTAIQLTTASGICTIVDLVFRNKEKYHGLVRQEQFSFDDFVRNPFGNYYNSHTHIEKEEFI